MRRLYHTIVFFFSLGNFWILNQNVWHLICQCVACHVVPCADAEDDHQQYMSFNFLRSKKDDDVYGMPSQTMPLPSLPDQLVFTGDNFGQKIRQAEKVAVVFYIGCECLHGHGGGVIENVRVFQGRWSLSCCFTTCWQHGRDLIQVRKDFVALTQMKHLI